MRGSCITFACIYFILFPFNLYNRRPQVFPSNFKISTIAEIVSQTKIYRSEIKIVKGSR